MNLNLNKKKKVGLDTSRTETTEIKVNKVKKESEQDNKMQQVVAATKTNKKIRGLHIRIDEDLLVELKIIAVKKRQSQNEIIVELINNYIKSNK